MEKKREYTHEDMETLGEEIELLRIRARQLDHDIRIGAISHEQWETSARALMERKKEIVEILIDVERYKQELRDEIKKERKLRLEAEAKIHELEEAVAKSEEAHKEELAKFSEVQDMAEKAKANEIDMMSIVRVIQNRIFNHNSDRMRFLNSQLDIDDKTVKEQGFEAMLESMKCHFPQSTLNKYIHQIMDYLRVRLEALMLEVIRTCGFVQNDETRILVRSRKNKEEDFKYNTEYIHAALSLEKKLVVMLYKEGSRSHEIPEEKS